MKLEWEEVTPTHYKGRLNDRYGFYGQCSSIMHMDEEVWHSHIGSDEDNFDYVSFIGRFKSLEKAKAMCEKYVAEAAHKRLKKEMGLK